MQLSMPSAIRRRAAMACQGTKLYRVVNFATHGLVGGEIASLTEPALALRIPRGPTELDDGS
jgi:hypothetical protein